MKRIAMWSGPRNISTAMMRAWENRSDCVVIDEPLYAYYLRTTGLDHPGREDVLAAQSDRWREVVDGLLATSAQRATILYQKHMAHHLCGEIELHWLASMEHGFLLREPRAMLISLAKVLPRVTLADTGLAQQLRLFEALTDDGGVTPPVIDARDVLGDPQRALRALCACWGVAFDPTMLRWPAGPRASDGVWARHWYGSVIKSTGFGPYREVSEPLPVGLEPLLEECNDIYAALYAHRLEV